MIRVGPRSLRGRLVLLATAGSAAVLALAMALLYLGLSAELDAAVNSGLAARAADVTVALQDSGRLPDDEPLAQLVTVSGQVLQERGTASGQALVDESVLRGATHGPVVVERDLPDGITVNLRIQPAPAAGELLVLGTARAGVERVQTRLLAVLLVTGPVLLGLLGAAAALVVRSALRPVGALTAEAAAIRASDADRRLPEPPSDDEIGRLARTLNGMLDRLHIAVERERAFVDDASHELRTPVAVLRGELELALASSDPAEREESVRAALAEADRLARLAEDLLVLARERAGALALRWQDVELRAIATTAAQRLRGVTEVDIEVAGAATWVHGDPGRLDQLLVNLVMNAAAAGAHQVQVSVGAAVEQGPEESVVVQVADDGPGLPASMLSSGLERFTRGDPARTRGSGAGLGLAIAAAIARAHGGDLTLGNGAPLGGALVTVRLPVLGAPAVGQPR